MNLARLLGPLTWAYVIIVGGVLMITPDGIDPIVFRAAGAVGVVLGIAGFAVGRQRRDALA
jgi:hypothetical protein